MIPSRKILDATIEGLRTVAERSLEPTGKFITPEQLDNCLSIITGYQFLLDPGPKECAHWKWKLGEFHMQTMVNTVAYVLKLPPWQISRLEELIPICRDIERG